MKIHDGLQSVRVKQKPTHSPVIAFHYSVTPQPDMMTLLCDTLRAMGETVCSVYGSRTGDNIFNVAFPKGTDIDALLKRIAPPAITYEAA